MKKTRFIALVLAAAVLALCLTSCAELDRARESYATWETPYAATINYQGTTYKLLPIENTKICPDLESAFGPIYVCTSDVPLLLRKSSGIFGYLSRDNLILRIDGYTYAWDYDYSVPEYCYFYCVESEYDYFSALLENFVLKNYHTSIWNEEQYDYIDFVIEGKYSYAMNEIISSVAPMTKEEESEEDAELFYNRTVLYFVATDEKNIFAEKRGVIASENGYYLISRSGEDYNDHYYKVPDEYKPLFDELKAEYYELFW